MNFSKAVTTVFFELLIVLLAVTVVAQADDQNTREVVTNKSEAGCGELYRRTPDGLVALPAVETDVSLEVTGPLVAGTITQRFVNDTDEVIEAIYVFPMPEDAAVNQMEMLIGERRIISRVKERAEARKVYERAKKSGKRAALVESERVNLFTTSVANIGPGQSVTVKLQYLDQALYVDGWFSLAFPLTFTPRYNPPALLHSTDSASGPVAGPAVVDATRISPPFVPSNSPQFPEATIAVTITPGVPLAEVLCSSHAVDVEQIANAWSVTPTESLVKADRDFLLKWRAIDTQRPAPALFVEDRPDGRYVMLMIVPSGETDISTTDVVPTETMFVVDVSGSMDGPSIRQARKGLIRAIERQQPGDRFNILAFNSDSRLFSKAFNSADEESKAAACHWVSRLQAEDGTEMYSALLRATTQFLIGDKSVDDYNRRIVLITDASIGNEDQLLRELTSGLGQLRLHVVGIGSAPNRYLVRRLASLGGGLSTFVSEEATASSNLDSFLERIARPQLSNPALTWPAAEKMEAYPQRLQDLYSDELLLWSARFPVDTPVQGVFTAQFGQQNIVTPLAVISSDSEDPGIATRWGRLKIDNLMAEMLNRSSSADVREEIVDVGIKFGLVTKYTSRVAVEEIVSTSADALTYRLANGLPAGSKLLGELPQGGTSAPLLRLIGWLLFAGGLTGACLNRNLWLPNRGGRS